MELCPETFEPLKRYSVPNLFESVKVKVQVMQRVKGRRVDFAYSKQVPQIRPGTGPAGIAIARRIRRPIILGVPRILNIDRPFAGEQLSVSGVPRGQHAVEEVDTARHGLYKVQGRSGAHQVSRAVLRQATGRAGHDVVHDVGRLSDAQSTDRVRLETDADGAPGAFLAQCPARRRPAQCRTGPARGW